MICFSETLRFIVVVSNQTSSISKICLQFLKLKGGRSWKMPLNITDQMEELQSTEGRSYLRVLGHLDTTEMDRMLFCLQGVCPPEGRARGRHNCNGRALRKSFQRWGRERVCLFGNRKSAPEEAAFEMCVKRQRKGRQRWRAKKTQGGPGRSSLV